MGVFKLGKMTFGSLFKKPETVKYPFETKPQPAGLKGHIVIEAESCILCGMCQRSCPTDCITVDKAASTWSVFPFQCIQCGYCTQVCPKKCLAMDPNYAPAATAKVATVVTVPQKEKAAAKPAKEPAEAKAAAKPASEKAASKPVEMSAAASVASEPAKESTLDNELVAKLALMDDEKAERVRKALMSR